MSLQLQVWSSLSGDAVCVVEAEAAWNIGMLKTAIKDARGLADTRQVFKLFACERLLSDNDTLRDIWSESTGVVNLIEIEVPEQRDLKIEFIPDGCDIPTHVRCEYTTDPDWTAAFQQLAFDGSHLLALEPVETAVGSIEWLGCTKVPPGEANFRFVFSDHTERTCTRLNTAKTAEGDWHFIDCHFLWDDCLNAANMGTADKIRRCVMQGAPLETQNAFTGDTAIIVASRRGHQECVRALLEQRANIHAQNFNGNTALNVAVMADQNGCFEALLHEGVPIDTSMVDLAASLGSERCLRMLIDRGSSLNATNVDGNSPLMTAVLQKKTPCVRMLCEAGADVDTAHAGIHQPAVAVAASGNSEDCLLCLLDHRADVDAQGPDGTTAIMASGEAGHHVCLRVLLEHSASTDHHDSGGRTAAARVVAGWGQSQGRLACLRLLAERGAEGAAEALRVAGVELEAVAVAERELAQRRWSQQQKQKIGATTL